MFRYKFDKMKKNFCELLTVNVIENKKNLKKLPKIVKLAPYYIWGFYEKYDRKF